MTAINAAKDTTLTRRPNNNTTASLPRSERLFMAIIQPCKIGQLRVTCSNGMVQHIKGNLPGPSADLTIKDPAMAMQVIKRGAMGFAEGYLEGYWKTSNLTTLLFYFLQNKPYLEESMPGSSLWRLLSKLKHWKNRNTRRQASKNITYHYDLGNAFYSHWLDSSMTYSAALFEGDHQDLARAQSAKYQKILDMLPTLSVHDHILEIGCGWGGFAEHYTTKHKAKYTGITISPEQLRYANKRLSLAKKHGSAQCVLQDYRDIDSRYDHIVSIEMIEAVGMEWWSTYFEKVKQALKPSGRAVIQSILIKDNAFDYYRENPDFIQRYIFPGGCLPSKEKLAAAAAEHGLVLEDSFHFGDSYSKTLGLWQQRFNETWPDIAKIGFDQRFKRLWNYYLSYCTAGFLDGQIDVALLAFGHSQQPASAIAAAKTI